MLSLRMSLVARVLAFLLFATGGQARGPDSVVDRMSTLERVEQPGWWPTKLLSTRKDFVGSEACAQCHAGIAESVKGTAMARALLQPNESEILRNRDGQTFQFDSYRYKLEHTTNGYQFHVNQGTESVTQPITWVFGDGGISQVYVTDHQGKFYESHFSYYSGTNGFAPRISHIERSRCSRPLAAA